MEQIGSVGNLIYMSEYALTRKKIMYDLSLTKEQLIVYVTGLDSSIKLMCQQIMQSPQSGLILKQLLPKLQEIDKQFQFLQEIVDKTEENINKLNGKLELPSDETVLKQ